MIFFHFFFKAIFRTSKMAIRQTTNCFPETFQGLLSRYLGILPNFFQGMFRDFCPIIWAFCVFFSRTHFRDFCSVIWAFCGFFSQGTFQGLLSRYLGILPFFFQETFQGLLSRYLGILQIFFSRLAKTAEQLSNF